eukprot:5175213-Prymnesium_polylepis.1
MLPATIIENMVGSRARVVDKDTTLPVDIQREAERLLREFAREAAAVCEQRDDTSRHAGRH